MRGGAIIKIFSIIALVFELLQISLCFFYCIGDKFFFNMPSVDSLVVYLFAIAPFVLFFVYVIACHKKYKASFLIPLVYILLLAGAVNNIINCIVMGFSLSFYGVFMHMLLIIAYVFAIISGFKAFKGTVAKVFIIISMSLCILKWIIATVHGIPTMENIIRQEQYYFLTLEILSTPAPIFLYVATLLLGAKNTLRPASTPARIEAKPTQDRTVSAGEALRSLNEKYEKGLISEQDYEAQRATIVKFL